MDFTNKDIEDMIAAWEADFGERLAHAEARIHAIKLHTLYCAMADMIAAQPELFADVNSETSL